LEEIYEKIPELKSVEYIIPPLYGLIYFKNCSELTVDMLIKFKNLLSIDNVFVGVAEYDVDLGERNQLPKEEKYKFIEDALYEGNWTYALNAWHFCTEHHIDEFSFENLCSGSSQISINTSSSPEPKKIKVDENNEQNEKNEANSFSSETRNNLISKILECRQQNLFDLQQCNYFKSEIEGCKDLSQREIAFRGTFLKYDYKSKEVRTQQLASYIGDATFKKYMEEGGPELFKGKLKVNLKQWDLEVWGAFIRNKNWEIGEKDKHCGIAGVHELNENEKMKEEEKKDTTNCSVNTSTYDKYKILYGITLPLNNYVKNDKSINHRNRCKFGRTSLRPTVGMYL